MLTMILSLLVTLNAQAATVTFLPNTILPRDIRDVIRSEITDKCSKEGLVLKEVESLHDFQNVFDSAWVYVWATKFEATYKENGVIQTEKYILMRSEHGWNQRYGFSRNRTSRIVWNEDAVCNE